jgi:two-component system OmpR family response regulator
LYILVVEDDADVAKFVVSGLREAGHVVEFAANGQDGLALALAKHFDVIILDRQLPGGIDGANILKTVREKGITTAALFLSGLGQLSDWVKGLQSGGDDYIVKPASIAEILRRVEALHEQVTAANGPGNTVVSAAIPG